MQLAGVIDASKDTRQANWGVITLAAMTATSPYTITNSDVLVIKNYTTPVLTISGAGNVGIGTNDPQSKLAVNGTITAKEVVVTETGWPDFVFADDYDLRTLDEVESYIAEHKHLQGIPPAAEVQENGISLGEMQAKLLEKIED